MSVMRRWLLVALWILLIAVAAAAINAAGIRLVGGVGAWEQWLAQHEVHSLVWRLMLYGATGYGWWWMRARLLLREPGVATRVRLLRVEVAAVLTVVILEGAVLLS